MSFIESLNAAWSRTQSLLCVGLDPEPSKFPGALNGRADAIFEFCKPIVDATAPYASSFKPQIAYFAAHRAEDQLEALIAHIHEKHPGIPVILDAKRGDIGSTAEQYAKEAFERYEADAVTVNPYMGFDSIEPYLAHEGKGVIVLCRTSNAGGSDLQFLTTDGKPLYQVVAQLAAREMERERAARARRRRDVSEGNRNGARDRRRHAAADSGHRRAGRRCRSDRARRAAPRAARAC